MNVVVYSADVGDYDDVWPIAAQEGPHTVRVCRYFGDGPHPAELRGRLAGRWYKCHPDLLFPDADVTVWVDACLEVTSATFVAEALDQLGDASYAAISHPDRDNIYDEVTAAAPMEKYRGNNHAEMVSTYTATLGRDVPGLLAMAVLVRRNDATARAIDRAVWDETLKWSGESVALDQLALPFVAATQQVDVARLSPPGLDGAAGTLWANAWFRRHRHHRET